MVEYSVQEIRKKLREISNRSYAKVEVELKNDRITVVNLPRYFWPIMDSIPSEPVPVYRKWLETLRANGYANLVHFSGDENTKTGKGILLLNLVDE
jgi:hypothetical protein